MALNQSPKQRYARVFFAITYLVLGIGEKCYARTTTEVYSTKVDVCPQNQTEWQEASRRLNCSDDAKSPVNKYHCLPVHNLTSLLEFCYSGHRPQVVKGFCMTYVQDINYLDSYNCTTFDDGCPDTFYHSDETYKFPKCTKIDPFSHCYVADSSCRKNTTVNETSTSKTTQKSTDNKIAIIISTSVVLFLGAVICIVATVVIKRRKCNCLKGKGISRKGLIDFCVTVKARKGVKMPLLNVDKANITRLGLNYLLQSLPTDEESIHEIAKILNVPPEIVRWSKDNRQRFVKSMKKGTIPVYSGRGMVIGCAEAGKTTLVKKLKGENNLSTTSTIGIDIHAHEFKLDAEECTIISCMQNEKDKGCLSIHPAAVDQKMEINTEKGEPSQSDSEETYQEYRSRLFPSTTNEQILNILIGQEESSSLLSIFGRIPYIDDTDFEADTSAECDFDSFNVYRYSKAQFSQEWDFSDCVASTNENSLKVLSILDFAGQSAYYACHHIFFSPRAFYILVVDMSKDLKSHAERACDKDGLIYSDWTYADYITYWLGSIHTYGSKSAPVILVASHSESIGSDPNKKQQ